MLHGQRIAFVFIIDNNSKMVPELKVRVWHHEKLVKSLLKKEVCVIGRKTQELTGWKGPRSWVLTKNKKWKREGIGTIGSLDDLHLHSDTDTIYILGGKTLFRKMQFLVDELHMYVINDENGTEVFPKLKMNEWKAVHYHNENVWSYGHLEKRKYEEEGFVYLYD